MCSQGEVWLYNVCEQIVKNVFDKLSSLRDWLACRSGLLHHLLAQKMGLFKHCQGPAVQTYAKVSGQAGTQWSCRTDLN